MNNNQNIIEIKKLNVDFSSPGVFSKKTFRRALDNINLNIPKGISLGIVGESGSGKSTLAKAIVRLLDVFHSNAVVTGDIIFYSGGQAVNINKIKLSAMKKIRKEIQIVFQDPSSSLSPKMTVREIITEPFLNFFNPDKKEISDKLDELISLTGLNNVSLDSFPNQLSGGQKQRVAIARSLSANPSVLIADEIVSALDVSIQGQILNLILDLKRKMNLTLLFISHDLAVIRNISDYTVVMNLGKIVEEGATEIIFTRPKNDYTKNLLSSIPVISNGIRS
jgi:ABC-type oligopeptide transport system ATPase subunit